MHSRLRPALLALSTALLLNVIHFPYSTPVRASTTYGTNVYPIAVYYRI